MRLQHSLISLLVSLGIAACSMWLAAPWVFAGRVLPGILLATVPLGGVPVTATDAVVAQYERELLTQKVRLKLKDKEIIRTLGELGVSLDKIDTAAAIQRKRPSWIAQQHVETSVTIDEEIVAQLAGQELTQYLTLPQNASLSVVSVTRTVRVTPSRHGEAIDVLTLATDIEWHAERNQWDDAIELTVVSAPPAIHEGEVGATQDFVQRLLRSGFTISNGPATWVVQPFTLERLLTFIPTPDPRQPTNEILGISVDPAATIQYLEATIATEVNQPAIDARFERIENRVTQFSAAEEGRTLNMEGSLRAIQTALATQQTSSSLVVDSTQPTVQAVADVQALGLTALLASGTSNYKGSPANRIHNILEGTKRYHGLLIKPGQEFSFNEFLGPVDKEHGFRPELVIKKNVTVPEFGGGLCQVSTTIFRAATYAGLKITDRRNHAYAVSYYGTPGFDATIYPPYTDLRFTNNTPGYILIQAKSEGTQLTFELWGTQDGRQVEIDGPHPYGRTPDGAVKATLSQKVIKNDELIIDDTFYSRYQSPNLFPKPNASPPTPTPSATPTPPPAPPRAATPSKPTAIQTSQT